MRDLLNLAGAQRSVAPSVRHVPPNAFAKGVFGHCRLPRPPFGGHNNDANQGLPADG